MKRDKIKQLLDLTGFAEILNAQISKMIGLQVNPQIKYLVEKEFDILQIQDKIIDIYDNYFHEVEIEEIMKFLEMPVGRKMMNFMSSTNDLQKEVNEWMFNKYSIVIKEIAKISATDEKINSDIG